MARNIDYISEYITYYKNLDNPGYAILVTGEWGSGKTYRIKKELTPDEMYYISLFDISSVADIYASVFVKMSPAKAFAKSAAGSIGESSLAFEAATFGLGGLVGKIADAMIKEDVKKDKIIVFDDIERCPVNKTEILGVINKYVEHHGCKVIAIAHDGEVPAEFNKSKEKVIGQTIKITPKIKDVFYHFIDGYYQGRLPTDIQATILNSFIISECNSLRILKHIISDSIRLYECLNTPLLEKKNAIESLFTFFSALSIQYRYGALTSENIKNKNSESMSYYINIGDHPKPFIVQLSETYKESGAMIDFSREILSDAILNDTLVNGNFDKNEIANYLTSSDYFKDPDLLPPWRIILDFDDMPIETINKAVEDMSQQLLNNEIINVGEIIHSFNLKLLLSKTKHTSQSYKEVILELKKYLLRLINLDLLEGNNPNDRFNDYREMSHGYTYWIDDEYRPFSIEIFKAIDHFRKIASLRKYPSHKNKVLETIDKKPKDLQGMLSISRQHAGELAYIPFLNTFKPLYFVELWLSLDIDVQRNIGMALHYRYSGGSIHRELKPESKWLAQVNTILLNKASKERGLESLRISRLFVRS